MSESEKASIDAVRARYETSEAAAVEAMRIVQDSRRWISDEALADIADYLGVSTSYLDSLATFYSLIFRHPVGRHVILVCDSVCCWMDGSEEILRYLGDRLGIGLGETTADGRFTLLPIVCLGACDKAPAMLIDWRLHGKVTVEDLPSILALYP